MSSRTTLVPLFAALAFTTACASAPGTTIRTARMDADRFNVTPAHRMIARSEIAASGAQNAEEVIRRFRPLLLSPTRSPTRLDGRQFLPTVYVDDLKAGGVEVLRSYPTSLLRAVQYLTESEANSRWVGVHPAGAILLKTREE